jgi:hypothetical protein
MHVHPKPNASLVPLLVGAAIAILAACAPTIEGGGCSKDVDCKGRAEVCDVEANECVPKEVDTSSTQNPAPMSFSGVVPFHRGTVCMPHEVKSGEEVPVTLTPCIHSCLVPTQHQFKHFYSCKGARCDAWAMMYVEASSGAEGCPADAFGQFDRTLCLAGDAARSVSFGIGTTIDSGPVNGTMNFEIPFLSNADAAAIAAAGNATAVIQEKIDQYPQDDARVPGDKPISLSPNHPVPPANCESGCTCYDIGF